MDELRRHELAMGLDHLQYILETQLGHDGEPFRPDHVTVSSSEALSDDDDEVAA